MDKFISATAINAGLQLANQVTNVVSQHGLEKKRFGMNTLIMIEV